MIREQQCFYDQYYAQLCEALGVNLNKGKTVTVAITAGASIKVIDEIKDTDYEVN